MELICALQIPFGPISNEPFSLYTILLLCLLNFVWSCPADNGQSGCMVTGCPLARRPISIRAQEISFECFIVFCCRRKVQPQNSGICSATLFIGLFRVHIHTQHVYSQQIAPLGLLVIRPEWQGQLYHSRISCRFYSDTENWQPSKSPKLWVSIPKSSICCLQFLKIFTDIKTSQNSFALLLSRDGVHVPSSGIWLGLLLLQLREDSDRYTM